MVYENFHEKAFTKGSYLKQGCLHFKGYELEFWLLKRQLSNLRPFDPTAKLSLDSRCIEAPQNEASKGSF
jgi:hypothetical protein